jgi:hypothetical protein
MGGLKFYGHASLLTDICREKSSVRIRATVTATLPD